jgi:hypothetical protein
MPRRSQCRTQLPIPNLRSDTQTSSYVKIGYCGLLNDDVDRRAERIRGDLLFAYHINTYLLTSLTTKVASRGDIPRTMLPHRVPMQVGRASQSLVTACMIYMKERAESTFHNAQVLQKLP